MIAVATNRRLLMNRCAGPLRRLGEAFSSATAAAGEPTGGRAAWPRPGFSRRCRLPIVLSMLFFGPADIASAVEVKALDGGLHRGDIMSSDQSAISMRLGEDGRLILARDDAASVQIAIEGAGTFDGPLLEGPSGAKSRADGWSIDLRERILLSEDHDVAALRGETVRTALAPGDPLRLAASREQDDVYSASIAIEALVKIQLLPEFGLDVNTVFTDATAESVTLLRQAEAELGLISLDPEPDKAWEGSDAELRLVACLWKRGDQIVQLVASTSVADESVYQITRTIFDNLPFLTHMNAAFADMSLDTAVSGSALRIHPGAKRYFRERRVLTPDVGGEDLDDHRGYDPRARM